MAWRTRSAVAAVTLSDPLMVRDTVAVETLASRATSLMFMGVCVSRIGPSIGRPDLHAEPQHWQPYTHFLPEVETISKPARRTLTGSDRPRIPCGSCNRFHV